VVFGLQVVATVVITVFTSKLHTESFCIIPILGNRGDPVQENYLSANRKARTQLSPRHRALTNELSLSLRSKYLTNPPDHNSSWSVFVPS
jgi:hypothetical protein